MSNQANPEEVFVPLAKLEIDQEVIPDEASHSPVSDLPSSQTSSPVPAKPFVHSAQADEMRRALETLPVISDQLAAGIKLAEENDQLKAELAALRLLVRSPVGGAAQRLQGEVERLTIRVNNLRQVVRAAEKGGAHTGRKLKPNSPKPRHDSLQGSIDPEKIAMLAIALTEGNTPGEIAGQLLDEVDRIHSKRPLFRDGEECSRTVQLESCKGRMEQKVHELEGIVEVTMARMTLLEGQLAGLTVSPIS